MPHIPSLPKSILASTERCKIRNIGQIRSSTANDAWKTARDSDYCLYYVVLTGDFNIDILKLNSNEQFQELYNTLTKIDLLPVITLPTRMSIRNATLIDQIYCISSNPLIIADSGIFAAKISDHREIFAALNFNINKTYTVTDKISIRSFTGRNIDSFTNELEDINWHQDFDHNPTADQLILYDNTCSTKLEEVMNNHFPLKDVKFNNNNFIS